MRTQTFEVGARPRVILSQVGGDVEVEGYTGTSVVFSGDTLPHIMQQAEQLLVGDLDDDLKLRVPSGASVSVGRADGDGRFRGFRSLSVDMVNGDVEVVEIAERCSVSTVNGDARLTGVSDLEIGTINGDALIERVRGRLALGTIGGDAVITGDAAGFGPARVNGDAVLKLAFRRDEEYELEVDGDCVLYLPEDADLAVEATVGGEVTGLGSTTTGGAYMSRWGTGSAKVRLKVGQDLWVRGPGASFAAGLETTIGQTVDSIVSSVVNSVANPRFVDSIVSSVVESVTSAFRPPTGGWRSASGESVRSTGGGERPAPQAAEQPGPAPASAAPTEDERVLRVLEAVSRGEITPEEAERLLGGEPGPAA